MRLAQDTWLLFHRHLVLSIRRPMFLFFGLVQPITYLLIFAPFLLPALKSMGGGEEYSEAYQVYVPGLLVAICLFGGLFAGFGLLAEVRAGIIERCRVTPISRTAMLLGRALRDVVTMLAQSAIVIVLALPFGLLISIPDLVLSYLLLGLIGLMTAALSYGMTLAIKDEQTLGQIINAVSQPIGLLAGVLVPIALAPAWIQSVAFWNPFTWATDGVRALFAGHTSSSAVWEGLAVVAILTVASVLWSARLFNRAAR